MKNYAEIFFPRSWTFREVCRWIANYHREAFSMSVEVWRAKDSNCGAPNFDVRRIALVNLDSERQAQ